MTTASPIRRASYRPSSTPTPRRTCGSTSVCGCPAREMLLAPVRKEGGEEDRDGYEDEWQEDDEEEESEEEDDDETRLDD